MNLLFNIFKPFYIALSLCFFMCNTVHAQPAAEFVRQYIVGTWVLYHGHTASGQLIFSEDSLYKEEVIDPPYEPIEGFL